MSFCIVSSFESPKVIMRHCTMTMQTTENYPVHTHKGYELLLLKKGEVSYVVDGQTHSLRKNSLVFTRPDTPHRIQVESDDTYDRYNLLFSPDSLPKELLEKIPSDLHVLHFGGDRLVTGIFEKMDYYCQTLPEAFRSRAMKALTEEMLWNIIINTTNGKDDHSRFRHPLTGSVLDYMDRHLLEIQTVDQICVALGVSKSYLHQIFRDDLSSTPKAYLNQRRLELARREILLGAKASALYTLCGFDDYSAFYRAYKKQFGYTPSETQETAFQTVSEK